MKWNPHAMSLIGLLIAGLAVALAIVVVRRAMPAPIPDGAVTGQPAGDAEPGTPQPPPGLVAARSRDGEADVVAFDGQAWREIVPASALPPVEEGGRVLAESVRFVVPEPGLARIALVVAYCAADSTEAEACTSRGYVFDRADGRLQSLGEDVVPSAWLPDGRLLVDAISAGGRIFDPASGATAAVAGPDADYTIGFGAGLSPDGRRIALSTGSAEKVVDIATGAAVVFAGEPSVDRTPWLAFSPDGGRVAAAQRRVVAIAPSGDETSRSRIAVFDTATGAHLATASPEGAHDTAPAWANGGRTVVFLRADGEASGTDFFEPARVMRYDVDSATTGVLVDAVALRRDIVAPGSGGMAAYLERTADGATEVVVVDLATGASAPVFDDGFDYTALAWASAQVAGNGN